MSRSSFVVYTPHCVTGELEVGGSQLIPFGKFLAALRKRADELSRLEGDKLDGSLQVEVATVRLWKLVATLGIVENMNPLVAGSKCLHHLLPDLVSPMDR